MIRTFTQDDVIRYVYHETSFEENNEIERAILCDSKLQSIFKEIRGIKKRLDEAVKAPSDKVINNILNYSKSLNLLSNK
jgi:chromatin remodeling complex protein RSC6